MEGLGVDAPVVPALTFLGAALMRVVGRPSLTAPGRLTAPGVEELGHGRP